MFLAEVDRLQPKVVILDTFGRAVDGDENDADTVRAFYRLTGSQLKQRKIAYLRVDHTGKDFAKGARGSSAKNDDVDLIWSMQRTVEGFQLKSRSRVSWVPAVLNIRRVSAADRLYYTTGTEIADLVMDENVTAKVYELEELGLDPTMGRDQVVKALAALGVQPGRLSVLSQAIKYRKDAARRGVVVRRPDPRPPVDSD
jgi:RecA-family ATPase